MQQMQTCNLFGEYQENLFGHFPPFLFQNSKKLLFNNSEEENQKIFFCLNIMRNENLKFDGF